MACDLSGLSVVYAVIWEGWSPLLAHPRSRIVDRPHLSADSASQDTFHQATGVSVSPHPTCKENQAQLT